MLMIWALRRIICNKVMKKRAKDAVDGGLGLFRCRVR